MVLLLNLNIQVRLYDINVVMTDLNEACLKILQFCFQLRFCSKQQQKNSFNF